MEILRKSSVSFLFCISLCDGNGIHSGLRNRGESMRVQVPPQVLCAYIRIGIGAALRMQSVKPVEVRVLLRTLISPRSRIGICIGFKLRGL